ncbi:MAG TPA: Crp/Fnr family transcriptional regulator [Acidobacteriota bacterium]
MGVNPKLLRRSSLFAELPAAEVNAIAELASMRWFDRGECLFRQGDEIEALYVVFDGAIKLSRVTPAGRTMVVDFRGPGQVVGGRAVVGQSSHGDDAHALEDVLTAVIPLDASLRFLASRPAVIMALARYLSWRLESREEKAAGLATKRVHQRLADGLLELGRGLGVAVDGVTVINARFTQAEIADWIGTTRETTSTLLNGLRRAGHIDIVGRRIHLLNPRAIELYAELEEPPGDLASLAEAASGTRERELVRSA